jgi:hypothetical protein
MQAPLEARSASDAAQTDTARTVAEKPVLADNRPDAVAQRKLRVTMNNSSRVLQQRALSDAVHNRHQVAQREEKTNKTGLPSQLKSGIESLSGMSMDHVKVHYNSDKPAQLQAHAYAQGSEIHLGAGQERHLPHEAWHVVQQAQGRVRPTFQMKAGAVNDDPSLEQEADMMGQKAAQFKGDHDAHVAGAVTQRGAGFQAKNIHIALGQDRHLPHDAGHMVQQLEGRVQPTMQMHNGTGQHAAAGPTNSSTAATLDASSVSATCTPVQRKMGLEWETSITAVKDWGEPITRPPAGVLKNLNQEQTEEKSDEAKVDSESSNSMDLDGREWSAEAMGAISKDPTYRYAQDETIWSAKEKEGWVIDSDNSKLEFVTDPPVNLCRMVDVLKSMSTAAATLPAEVATTMYLRHCGINGSSKIEPVLLGYKYSKTFAKKVTGKPQLTVGIKFRELYRFISFLTGYNLKSSITLHESHVKLANRNPAASASSNSSTHLTHREAQDQKNLSEEKSAQKTAIGKKKLIGLLKSIEVINGFLPSSDASSSPSSSSTPHSAVLEDQFGHVKGLVLMMLHYVSVITNRSRPEKYKKMSFPLLLRSSFSSMYAVLGPAARTQFVALLSHAKKQAGLPANAILFEGVPGEITFEEWVQSIITPGPRQIKDWPDYTGDESDHDAVEKHNIDGHKAVDIEADLMSAPGAFAGVRGNPTDKSMGNIDKLDFDGDDDQLVVIELRDVSQFVQKELGGHTADTIRAFYLDLMEFKKHGFIKDE